MLTSSSIFHIFSELVVMSSVLMLIGHILNLLGSILTLVNTMIVSWSKSACWKALSPALMGSIPNFENSKSQVLNLGGFQTPNILSLIGSVVPGNCELGCTFWSLRFNFAIETSSFLTLDSKVCIPSPLISNKSNINLVFVVVLHDYSPKYFGLPKEPTSQKKTISDMVDFPLGHQTTAPSANSWHCPNPSPP